MSVMGKSQIKKNKKQKTPHMIQKSTIHSSNNLERRYKIAVIIRVLRGYKDTQRGTRTSLDKAGMVTWESTS